ncbi:MAG: type II secretion system F family protein [Oscillibacter sp.]|nr:type II secretion system F family protein [Oscillibacter sp.]
MAQFKYSALSRSGERVTGIIEGYNELDAAARVKETCGVILKIRPIAEKKDDDVGILNMEIGGPRLNKKAFIVMCSQFAIILRSGVPVVRTVELIASKTADKTLKKMLKKIAVDVEGGRSLSAAFEEHGAAFLPPTFVETLRAGEESGNLDRSFQTMHDHFDKQMKMGNKVKSAMSYPMFVLGVAVVVVIILMVKVIPSFMEFFEEAEQELPLPTQILIAISNFFRYRYPIILAVVAVIAIGYKLINKTENGHLFFAKMQLKLPVLGNIAELNAASQFANSMTTMLESGLTMNKAVGITARTLDNYYLSTETGKLTTRLEEGHSLGASLRENQVLPDILVDMAGVGEETGELAETLNTIALYYDAELEVAIQDALAKLEPAMLIFLAVVAGGIVGTIYYTMFSMYSIM